MREALELVDGELAAIANAMAKLAKEHRLTPMIGRSNLQQAIPVTFGYRSRVCSLRSFGIASASRS
jgi:3-carboxy-cis,cis-muconate cycloisomerase